MGTGFIRMKNFDKTNVHNTIQIPRKIQILRSFNLNNSITDITMKNKMEMQKYLYLEKIIYG